MSGIVSKPAFRAAGILGLSLLFAVVGCLSPVAAGTIKSPSSFRLANTSATATTAKLSFRRVFKESAPEFIEITVAQDTDKATYEIRQL
ncbi:MAG TPA: hypothetical protein VHW24_10505, partial [Bryobacteraceae bacterium]|nr:hypothetical protein [Bryobacteraceae bacterium]